MILASKEIIKEYEEKGWWGTETIYDVFRHHVNNRPHVEAIIDPLNRETICHQAPKRLTYQQLSDEADRLAAILMKHGIKKDDIIAVQLPNTVEIVISYLAILRIGAIVTPLPVQYREHEYDTLLNFVEAKAVLTMSRILNYHAAQTFVEMRSKLPTIETIFAWGEAIPAGVLSIDQAELSLEDNEYLQQEIAANPSTTNDIFTICWTSGTEGKPKGVPRSHNEWLISAYASVDVAEFTEEDVLLNTFPMVNMAGIGGMFVPWLIAGSKLMMHHPFDLPVLLQQVATERATYTLAPPALLNMMLNNEAILKQANFSTLRAIGSGSTPLSSWMVRGWKEKFDIDIINYFGSNEGATFISGPRDIPNPEQRANFFPRFGVKGYEWSTRIAHRFQSRIVDVETGEVITESGMPGEMRIKGASVLQGYWKREDLNCKVYDKDGFFCTGDLFEIVEVDGVQRFYRFVGRSKDIIIRGGINISPEEVEHFLQSHPKIAEVSVVGVPDKVMGEKACACIVLKNPEETIDLEEIIAFFKENGYATYKIPEYIAIYKELPRNPVGKILKHRLREQVLEEQEIEYS
ncbi:class I adenylate-forming enzyme family protein [Bacillus sp. REN10]|uniref:class I adenylate-forming enzyme family protein n=1 Tax=Bacillus sp. REN10 TaxID=2782541 RepID=UPI001EEF6CB3|nr:class I adenylate-forming enzyme family protein [Bacillus sp. REN10]